VNVKEIWTESVNWVSMAPDGVQLTNDDSSMNYKTLWLIFFLRDKFEEPSTKATHVRENNTILVDTNK